ncbi:hypothetical protein ELQ35_19635 [Peribacillus cavernae]|uniref:Uncharacterized protein n=1 Tax=Peribacillus cavernae TaxID=1674310 RepID=A0A433HCH8_9BACI|nr:hypothetical protein [Peribacillus cavernae]RUQ25805.1 hypothetical protein ELQ35_19635 [Peribacillus cavernae]
MEQDEGIFTNKLNEMNYGKLGIISIYLIPSPTESYPMQSVSLPGHWLQQEEPLKSEELFIEQPKE